MNSCFSRSLYVQLMWLPCKWFVVHYGSSYDSDSEKQSPLFRKRSEERSSPASRCPDFNIGTTNTRTHPRKRRSQKMIENVGRGKWGKGNRKQHIDYKYTKTRDIFCCNRSWTKERTRGYSYEDRDQSAQRNSGMQTTRINGTQGQNWRSPTSMVHSRRYYWRNNSENPFIHSTNQLWSESDRQYC